MNTRENSIKKTLLNDHSTNKKHIVATDINAWMETHQKKKSSLKQYHQPLVNNKRSNTLLPVNRSQKLMQSLEQTRDLSKDRREDVEIKASEKMMAKRHNENLTRNGSELLKEVCLNTIEQPSFKIRRRCNSKGYVLKQLRRKVKQLKHFSENRLPAEKLVQRIRAMNAEESIDFFQKKYRMISAVSSRTRQRKVAH